MSKFLHDFKPWVIVALVVMILSIVLPLASANDTIPEETAQPTITEDMGTVTPPTPVVEDDDIYMLPNTGAGTTAKELKSSNHTGWHYGQSYCDSGWYWVRWDYYYYWAPGIGHYSNPYGRIVILGGFCNPWN